MNRRCSHLLRVHAQQSRAFVAIEARCVWRRRSAWPHPRLLQSRSDIPAIVKKPVATDMEEHGSSNGKVPCTLPVIIGSVITESLELLLIERVVHNTHAEERDGERTEQKEQKAKGAAQPESIARQPATQPEHVRQILPVAHVSRFRWLLGGKITPIHASANQQTSPFPHNPGNAQANELIAIIVECRQHAPSHLLLRAAEPLAMASARRVRPLRLPAARAARSRIPPLPLADAGVPLVQLHEDEVVVRVHGRVPPAVVQHLHLLALRRRPRAGESALLDLDERWKG